MEPEKKRVKLFRMKWQLSTVIMQSVWKQCDEKGRPREAYDRAGNTEAELCANTLRGQKMFRRTLLKKGYVKGKDWFEEDTGRFFDEEVTATS